MQGLHLTADLYECQCEPARFTAADTLLADLRRAVDASGLTPVAQVGHAFAPTPDGPGGVTATVLLAESHVCVHTWPELNAVTLDVYVCNFNADNRLRARDLLGRLEALFQPRRINRQELTRGASPAHPPDTHTNTVHTPALILAAGRGERMRPLTDTCPKPLLRVQGHPLLAWHVRALTAGGFGDLVINTAWLADQISSFFDSYRLSDGHFSIPFFTSPDEPNGSSRFAARFSDERADFGGALETAGGIARALPLLGTQQPPQPPDVFWVVAGDVFVPDFVFSAASVDRFRASSALAHLWLVPNPPHNPGGDFGLTDNGVAVNLPKADPATPSDPALAPRYTYSTIGLYRAELFGAPWCDIAPGNPSGVKAPLAPLLRRAMDAGRVTAELYTGRWTDVGTPERLAELNAT
jgi:MurNAc alpha-1-phosphate uridylyltransferase